MPRELTLIVTDLHGSREGTAGDQHYLPHTDQVAHAPRLDCLELLLARARSVATAEWRSWLARAAGLAASPLPVAAISRCADQLPGAGDWWLANPVNLEAGLSHVRLVRQLALHPDEWLELEAQMDDVLRNAPLAFGGSSGANAYLAAGRELHADTFDPARVIGHDIHDFMPRGPDARILKRLMTELQMWLHEHPLNAKREARGAPPVNCLWIWGGGSLPSGTPSRGPGLPALLSDDAFATGLWRLVSATPQPLPSRLDAAAFDAVGTAPDFVIAVTLRNLAGSSDGERMRTLEQEWVAPAVATLRRGTVRKLRLLFSDRLCVASRTDLWRVWRRPRHWLEVTG